MDRITRTATKSVHQITSGHEICAGPSRTVLHGTVRYGTLRSGSEVQQIKSVMRMCATPAKKDLGSLRIIHMYSTAYGTVPVTGE